MTKRHRPFRSDLFSPALAGPALGLLVAAQLAAGPAAGQSRGSFSVSANVQPSCTVTTEGETASSSCSNFGDGSAKIERESSRSDGAASTSSPAGRSPSAMRPNDVNYVTITY